MWACAITFQETGDDDRFARVIERADLLHSHPFWSDMCALYWLRLGQQDKATETRDQAQDHPRSSVTEFVDHWIQLCEARTNGTEFRDALKQKIVQYAEDRIASGKGAYLFLDLSTLLLLGERDKVKELASRAIEEIDDASMQWFEPVYDCLKDLNFDAASLKDRWPTYQIDEGPRFMIAYIHFLAACDAIGQGDRVAARESFQSCIDQGVFFIWIHWASRAFLSRMNDGWPEWSGNTE